jgi:serine/threonine protein kinase
VNGSPSVPGSGLPDQLGPFRILGLLGEGGSGVVYAARWGHREIALKVLHPALVATPSERDRFFAEARLWAETDHPSVVKVLNVGALPDGRPYLAMEKLEGETLAARLRRGALSLPAALGIFEQLASAVETLHGRGLIHRDLKPENAMLVGGSYAVLLDFGIAKSLDAPASTVTQDGGVRGTPAYMAPERFFGQPASASTDIYELGVVLYAMVVGRLPWGHSADPEARLNPTRPSEHGVNLPPGLETELLRALSTRAQARPASMAGFAAAVTAAAAHAGFSAQRRTADLPAPAAPPLETAPTVPGHPAAVPLAPLGPHPAPFTGPQQQVLTTDQVAARRGPNPWLVLGITAGLAAVAVIILMVALSGDEAAPASAAAAEPPATPPVEEEAEAAVAEAEPAAPPALDVAPHHPAATAFLARVDVAALGDSALGPVLGMLSTQSEFALMASFADTCNIDLDDDIHWISLGLAERGVDDFDLAMAGDWSRDDIEGCFQKVSAIAGGGAITRHDRLTHIAEKNGDTWLGWIDERTFLFSTRQDADRAWMSARLEGRDSVLDGAIGTLLGDLDRSATVWFAGDPGEALDDQLDGSAARPRAVFGDVAVARDMRLAFGLRYASEAEATTALASVQAQVDELAGDPAARALIGDIEVGRDGNDVRLRAHLSAFVTQLIGTAAAQELSKTPQ